VGGYGFCRDGTNADASGLKAKCCGEAGGAGGGERRGYEGAGGGSSAPPRVCCCCCVLILSLKTCRGELYSLGRESGWGAGNRKGRFRRSEGGVGTPGQGVARWREEVGGVGNVK